jgi:hypothetical protein
VFFVAIALTLALATAVYAAEVKSEDGNTVAVINGEGSLSGVTTLSAGDSATAIKTVGIETNGPVSTSFSDSGHDIASDDYVTAEINCNIVSYAVSATAGGHVEAYADVYARGDEYPNDVSPTKVWVEADIETYAYASSSDGGSASAQAKASGWAKATGTWDEVNGEIEAYAEGITTSRATSGDNSHAYNNSYIYSYAEVDPDGYVEVYDYSYIYSYSEASGDKAFASGTAQGKASASATAGGDGYDYDLSSTTSAQGRVLSQAAASGGGYAYAYAEIYAENDVAAGWCYYDDWDYDYYGVYVYDESYLEAYSYSEGGSADALGGALAQAQGMATSNGSASYSYTPESTVTDEASSTTSASGTVLSRLTQRGYGYTGAYAEIYAENFAGAGENYYDVDNYEDWAWVDDYSELYTSCYAYGYDDSYQGSAVGQAQGSASSDGSASYSYTAIVPLIIMPTITLTADTASSKTSAEGRVLTSLSQKAYGYSGTNYAYIEADNEAWAGEYYYDGEDVYGGDEAGVDDYSELYTYCYAEGYDDSYQGSALALAQGSASSSGDASCFSTYFAVTDTAGYETLAEGKILSRVSEKAPGYTYAYAWIWAGYWDTAWAGEEFDNGAYYNEAYADDYSEFYTYCYASGYDDNYQGSALAQAQGSAATSSSATYSNTGDGTKTATASSETSVVAKTVLSRISQKASGSASTYAYIDAGNYAEAGYDSDYGYYYEVYDDSELYAYGSAGSGSANFQAVIFSLAYGEASSNGSASYDYFVDEVPVYGCGGGSDTSASGKVTAQVAQKAAGSTSAYADIYAYDAQPMYWRYELELPGFDLDVDYAAMLEMSWISAEANASGSSETYNGAAIAQAQGEASASGNYVWYSSGGSMDIELGNSTTEASGIATARAVVTMLGDADAEADIVSVNLVDAYGDINIPGDIYAEFGDGDGAVVDLSLIVAATHTADEVDTTATALAMAAGATSASGDHINAVGELVGEKYVFVPDYVWVLFSETGTEGTAIARSQAQMAMSNCLAGAASVNIVGLVGGDFAIGGNYVPTVFDWSWVGTNSTASSSGEGSKASALGMVTAATSASGALIFGVPAGEEIIPDLMLNSATAVGATLVEEDGVSGLARATSQAVTSGNAGVGAMSTLVSMNLAQSWWGEGDYICLGLYDTSAVQAIAEAGSDVGGKAVANATATGATTSNGHAFIYDESDGVVWDEGWSDTMAAGSVLISAATTGPASAGSAAFILSQDESSDYYWYYGSLNDYSVIALYSESSVGEGGSALTKAVVNRSTTGARSRWEDYWFGEASSNTYVSGNGTISIANRGGDAGATIEIYADQDVLVDNGDKATYAFVGFGCGVTATDESPAYPIASVTGVNANAYADPDGLVSQAWIENGSAKAMLKPDVNYALFAISYDEVGASGEYAALDKVVEGDTDTDPDPNYAIAYAAAGADSDTPFPSEPPYLPLFPWGF